MRINGLSEIAVTGIGVVSALGNGYDAFAHSVMLNKNPIKPVTLFDAAMYKNPLAAEVTDFDPLAYLPKRGLRNMDRSTRFLCAAAVMALENAGIVIDEDNKCRSGVITGTTFGSLKSISDFDIESLTGESPLYVNPVDFPKTTINAPSSNVSILTGIMGYNTTISGGFTASLEAVSHGIDFLLGNKLDMVLACGVEDLSEQSFLYQNISQLKKQDSNGEASTNAEFSNGYIPGEGSVVFVLERLEDALKNKRHIYGRIKAVRQSFNQMPNYSLYNIPNKELYKKVIENTLQDSGITNSDIDLISVCANGWKAFDEPEAAAILEAFQGCKAKITDIKSMIGETGSVSGLFSLLNAIVALDKQKVSCLYDLEKESVLFDDGKDNNEITHINNALITCADPGGTLIGMHISKE